MNKYRDIFIKDGILETSERWRIYGSSRIDLLQRADGEIGREYLFGKRNLDVKTVADFRLGYVPFTRDHSFCGRIVMPIFDPVGDLIALSVRPVDDGIDPKYWNESFDKGENLFGLDLAKDTIAKMDLAIIVEGQFDVMAMHSHGLTCAVGLLGGAFTIDQAMLLKNLCKNFVFLMDGDDAGKKHAARATEVMSAFAFSFNKAKNHLNRHSLVQMKHTVVQMPEKLDPDKFLSTFGVNAMRLMLANAIAAAGMEPPPEFVNK